MHLFWKTAYKLFNAADKVPGVRLAMQTTGIRDLRERIFLRFVAGLPDRRYWNATIMPVLLRAGFQRILFVGCGSYTRHIHVQFEAAGIECWTSDIVPENAVWGNSSRHVICDIADISRHVPAHHFDAVLFNGVMGYGVTGADMARIAPVLHDILRDEGLLLVGWNKGLVEDPLTLPAVTERFVHTPGWSMPARNDFPGSTHVFDVFRRAANSPPDSPGAP